MAAILGGLVGGVLAIYLIAALIEWAVIKRVMDDPAAGAAVSVAIAYFVGSILYGFGAADGAGFTGRGFYLYLAPALLVGTLKYMRRNQGSGYRAD